MLALTSVAVTIALASPAEAARRKRAQAGGSYNPPYAAMVLDVKTGKVLYSENEDEPRRPASITKVMTLYLLFEQLERGKLSLDTPLRVSANAARQAPSKLSLTPGDTIEVEDAIKALVTKSANDVAVVVAENIAGSEDQFADQMTRKARSLGMTKTVYRNASGLPNPEQITSARDLVTLAQAIQDRFPKYYRYFQTRVFQYAGVSHSNHNKLLGRVEGVDGIKTGFTTASGFNLLTNVKTDDRHIIGVILGGRSGASRDQTMASLVRSNLPRAYAGNRQAPALVETAAVQTTRPTVVADASGEVDTGRASEPVEATAAVPLRAAKKPLDLNSLRPVVASASGAGTATPSQPLRLQPNAPLPETAQAYAPVETAATRPDPLRPTPASAVQSVKKVEERGMQVAAKAEPTSLKPEPVRTSASNWVIQLGATDDEGKAKVMLNDARTRSGKLLSGASGFTEKVTKGSSTLYRARFSGFNEATQAEAACKALKRTGFACFATRG